MSKKPNESDAKMRVTRLGAGKVSTGVHVAALDDAMAGMGTILTVPGAVAGEIATRGLEKRQ